MQPKKIVGLVCAVAAFAAAAPAFALDASTDGARAWTTDNEHRAHVRDTASDGHAVKAQYSWPLLIDDVKTLWETDGEGHQSKSAELPGQIWRIKACEDISFWPDECSGWDND